MTYSFGGLNFHTKSS